MTPWAGHRRLFELHDEWIAYRRYLPEASMAQLLGTETTAVFTGPTALPRAKKTT